RIHFRLANPRSLEFESGRFNNSIDCRLSRTFTDNDRISFAREIARVLTSNGKYFMLCFNDKEPTDWGGPRRITKEEIEITFSPHFNINYIRDAYFATRIHDNGGRAYLTSATKKAD